MRQTTVILVDEQGDFERDYATERYCAQRIVFDFLYQPSGDRMSIGERSYEIKYILDRIEDTGIKRIVRVEPV